jgi:hypothetical protein
MTCSLIDYGTDGATAGTNMILFGTLQTVVGSYGAALSRLHAVSPCFRVAANTTGVAAIDNFAVNTTGSVTNTPPSITTLPQGQAMNQGANVTFDVVASGTAP